MIEVIGSSPAEEDCVQVTQAKPYLKEMLEECNKFKSLLLKKYPPPDSHAYLRVIRQSHDFGGYYEVVAVIADIKEHWEWVDKMQSVMTWKELEEC